MVSGHAARCAALQALHERRQTCTIPNPFDAGSARILAASGFRALATTSAGVAFTLGRRDGMVRREEALANARSIVEAVQVPVSADLEICYGREHGIVAETMRLGFET